LILNLKFKISNSGRGVTLIEVVVAVGILAILAFGVSQFFVSMMNGIVYYRERVSISSLSDQYLEIARNLPYSQLGTVNGNPPGSLPDLPNAYDVSFGGKNYQIYYVVNYIDDPADGTAILGNDPAANDYKQIKLYIKNTSSGSVNSFLTNIVPKGLEGLASGGALSIEVFDSVGQPVSGVSLHITNTNTSPALDLTRTVDSEGKWVEVGLPDSANSYHIVAMKDNYSIDSTYPVSEQNQNPTKPDATISTGQVTQVSFSIDKLSDLVFKTVNQSCSAMPGVGLEIVGSKIIGTPNVLKFDKTYITDSGGNIQLSNIEWDSYSAFSNGSSYMVYGSSPAQPAFVLPDTSQNYNLILGPKTNNSLLVLVRDSSTSNPIEGVTVDLQTISPASDNNKLTGGSVLSQQDWSGGSGQTDFGDDNKYYQDDGNISSSGVPSGLRLLENGGYYVESGSLTSSTFDTGTSVTSYTNLSWQPTSQDPSTSIKFQIATNNDNETWDFVGPDGTQSTYYTTSGSEINSTNNNRRYLRYKVFLSTDDDSKTPVLTSMVINYISGCSTPGQVIFTGLQEGENNYKLIVSAPGYQTQDTGLLDISGYSVLNVSLSH
jgi:prepilin-type N-terminal cleavage/methylation domain-containing protein